MLLRGRITRAVVVVTAMAGLTLVPSTAFADEVESVVRVIPFGAGPVTVTFLGPGGTEDGYDDAVDPEILPPGFAPRQRVTCNHSIQGAVTATYQGARGGPYVLINVDSDFNALIGCTTTMRSLSSGARQMREGNTRAYSVRDECSRCTRTFSPGHDFCLGGPGVCDGVWTTDADFVLTLYSGTWGSYGDDCFLYTAQQLFCSPTASVYVPPVI